MRKSKGIDRYVTLLSVLKNLMLNASWRAHNREASKENKGEEKEMKFSIRSFFPLQFKI